MKKEIYKEKLELKEVSIDSDVPFTKINCPSCDEQVTADNVELGKAVAKCGSCHVVFPIANTLTSLVEPTAQKNKPIFQPEGIEIFEYKNQLEIAVSKNLNWVDIVMSFIAFFGILLFIPILIEKTFSIPLVITVLMFISSASYWFLFARKKNKVYFNLNQHTLDIERRPQYLMKDKSVKLDIIEQVC